MISGNRDAANRIDSRKDHEALLLRMLQDPPIHVWTCDLECRVRENLYSSPYSQIYSDLDRFIGGTDYDWLKPEDAEAAMEVKRRCIAEKAPARGGFTASWDGKLRYFDLVVVPNLDSRREMTGITCFILDITEEIDWLRSVNLQLQPDSEEQTMMEPTLAARLENLSQRLKFLMKRPKEGKKPKAKPAAASSAGAVILDEGTHSLLGPAGHVRLSRTEWRLVKLLMSNRGRVISHAEILREVWGGEYCDSTHLVHDAICRLRHRFEAADLDNGLIKSVHGIGYTLTGEKQNSIPPAPVIAGLFILGEVLARSPMIHLV